MLVFGRTYRSMRMDSLPICIHQIFLPLPPGKQSLCILVIMIRAGADLETARQRLRP